MVLTATPPSFLVRSHLLRYRGGSLSLPQGRLGPVGVDTARGGAPHRLVQDIEVELPDRSSAVVLEEPDAVVDVHPRGGSGDHELAAVGAPAVPHRRRRCVGTHLLLFIDIPHVEVAGEVAKAAESDKAAVRSPRYNVTVGLAEEEELRAEFVG